MIHGDNRARKQEVKNVDDLTKIQPKDVQMAGKPITGKTVVYFNSLHFFFPSFTID